MTKSRKRRSSSVEHRSTKRRKPSDEGHPVYSTRIITWEEQLSLPARFHEEKNVWPAVKIIEARFSGKRREFLLEWEAHPVTGEIFVPTWEPADNVGQELKQEWKRSNILASSPNSVLDSSPTISSGSIIQPNAPHSITQSRRNKTRRIVPDSSAEAEEEEAVIENSAPSRTPTLIGSPGSSASVSSPVEISETQLPQLSAAVHITVPPAPVDKGDWEALRESQFGSYETPNHSSSPFASHLRSQGLGPDTNQRASGSATRRQTTPSSTVASSVGSSLRSRSNTRQDRGHSVQRILDYQPLHESLQSSGIGQPFSTEVAQLSDSADILHSSGSQSGRHQTPLPHSQYALQLRRTDRSPQQSRHQLSDRRSYNPTVSRSQTSPGHGTQPWLFKSQLSADSQPHLSNSPEIPQEHSKLSGRCARKTTSNPASQESVLSFSNTRSSISDRQATPLTGMANRATRQSPRLQTAVPISNTTSPRIAVRTGSYRARAGLNPPEHSSPLAATAETLEAQDMTQQSLSDNSFVDHLASEQDLSNMSTMPPTSIAPGAMHLFPTEPALVGAMSQEPASYDAALNTLPTPVQDSIEDEPTSSAEDSSLASKASSSQESLRNEKQVPQVDGLVMPTYPIVGPDEYVIALPAEGKVQAIYSQTIKVKRNAILKFIHRRGSVNTASTSPKNTLERNEMIELIGRLHDTTTHIDLGLPGIPTQYTIPSQEHAAYADYAGSKFVFLGYLIELLQRRHETIVIMAKSGATQDLLEEYLYLKKVKVRRHERIRASQEDHPNANPRVELLCTKPASIVQLDTKPSLIIAFDASFESLDPQVRSLRERTDNPLPIVHLLVANSSEHVERCLPPSMPSPIRLRLLVRATYQSHMNLGGSPTIITNPSDEMDSRQMDLADINRAVRKSPNRKLQMVAAVVANATLSSDFAENWTLNSMPELALDELDETPSSTSTVSATPARNRARSQTPVSRSAGNSRNRSRTPLSRSGTPLARKRQLEIDTVGLASKRQRITPVGEFLDSRDIEPNLTREAELHRMVESLRAELNNEMKAREGADEARKIAEAKALDWQMAHAALQRRYEKRREMTTEQKKLNSTLTFAVEASKQKIEKLATENTALRQQTFQLKKDLETARSDIKSAGGDVATLEISREEARNAVAKTVAMEKSLESTKHDFEFLRGQYQDASNRAAELGTQVNSLESQVSTLSSKASDEKRRLKELNGSAALKQHVAKIQQLEAEKKSLQAMYRKLEEESKVLKRNRGVQTRGSSIAPASPGQRSRQGSPALGNLAPPSGSRASVLRHER